MDVLKESSEPSKEILALAQTRLESVLTAVGVEHQMPTTRPAAASGDASRTSQLQAQEQAAQALLRRSQEATRAMVSQADALRQREQALVSSGSTALVVAGAEGVGGGWPKGGGKSLSRKQVKTNNYFNKRFNRTKFVPGGGAGVGHDKGGKGKGNHK